MVGFGVVCTCFISSLAASLSFSLLPFSYLCRICCLRGQVCCDKLSNVSVPLETNRTYFLLHVAVPSLVVRPSSIPHHAIRDHVHCGLCAGMVLGTSGVTTRSLHTSPRSGYMVTSRTSCTLACRVLLLEVQLEVQLARQLVIALLLLAQLPLPLLLLLLQLQREETVALFAARPARMRLRWSWSLSWCGRRHGLWGFGRGRWGGSTRCR